MMVTVTITATMSADDWALFHNDDDLLSSLSARLEEVYDENGYPAVLVTTGVTVRK